MKMVMLIFQLICILFIGILVVRAHFDRFNRLLCVLAAILVTLSVVIEIGIHYFINGAGDSSKKPDELWQDLPVVLWWTPFIQSSGHARYCYGRKCVFTDSRQFENTSNPKAYAFYGTNLNITDLPVPRGPQLWALLHEESPRNTPHLSSEVFLSLFNYTSTFSRRSHLPLTTLYLESFADIRDLKYFIPTTEKNHFRSALAPILYVQSNCDTLTNRDAFVEELSKFVKVDSYGKCLHNTDLPQSLADAESATSEDFLRFASKYKFTLAIENAACDDYITEKLWRSLVVGSVPIYFGSPSVRDWLPNHDSAILISDFDSVEQLAAYITELDNDDSRYNDYLLHKLEGVVSNRFLRNVLRYRRWDNFDTLIVEFECQLCLRLHQMRKDDRIVDDTHYNCTTSTLLDDGANSDWESILRTGRCEGLAVYEFISSNTTYSGADVRHRSYQLMIEGAC